MRLRLLGLGLEVEAEEADEILLLTEPPAVRPTTFVVGASRRARTTWRSRPPTRGSVSRNTTPKTNGVARSRPSTRSRQAAVVRFVAVDGDRAVAWPTLPSHRSGFT